MSTEISRKNEIDFIISKMMGAVGAENDLQLGKILGYKSTSTVAEWRSKNKIPDGAFTRVSRISGKNFDEIRYGKDLVNEDSASYGKTFDWDLHREIVKMLRELEDDLDMRIRPEKFGGIIQMIYMDEITGTEVPKGKVIQLIKLAA